MASGWGRVLSKEAWIESHIETPASVVVAPGWKKGRSKTALVAEELSYIFSKVDDLWARSYRLTPLGVPSK
jgi:hypothetical protein